MRTELQIKVCGMRHSNNIKEVAATRPQFMGFIFYPKSLRFVELPAQKEALSSVGGGIEKVAVFVNASVGYILQLCKTYRFNYVQLHGNELPNDCRALQREGIKVIKAFSITEDFNFELLVAYQTAVSYFLFDTPTTQYGGSGKKFNWQKLDDYKGKTAFFLSGGISPKDAEQIKQVNHPSLIGVDINSGFEQEPALKDAKAIQQFINKLQNT